MVVTVRVRPGLIQERVAVIVLLLSTARQRRLIAKANEYAGGKGDIVAVDVEGKG
jgi:hypothetical protein